MKFTDRLRQYVLSNSTVKEVVVFDHLVFKAANVYIALLFVEKTPPNETSLTCVKLAHGATTLEILANTETSQIAQLSWLNNEGYRIETRLTGDLGKLVTKLINNWEPLGSVARASLGCQAYNSSKHTPEQIANRVFHASYKVSDNYLPELAGKDVGRYEINRQRGEWIKYGPWLHDYRTMDWLQGPRILIREIAGTFPYKILASYVEETYCNYKTILNVNPSSSTNFSVKYLLGLLNSRLLSFLYPYMSNKMVVQSFPRLSVEDVRRLPIRTINFSDPSDKRRHDEMAQLVETMLDLHKRLSAAHTPQERNVLTNRIVATDQQIDRLVYDLYALTDEEISIVEG